MKCKLARRIIWFKVTILVDETDICSIRFLSISNSYTITCNAQPIDILAPAGNFLSKCTAVAF
jgi:hypothetical protein